MLNLGILAHVDAGKTSLTERLLFDAGVIATMGAVDAGNTQTDRMELERRRGITIRSAVATFHAGDTEVHIIDTPGHPDFITEVERALGVLDGAILVLSAVEGVQAQTRILMRTLATARVPTLLFVNKIDRRGARHLLADIRRHLTPTAIAVSTPTDLGTPSAGASRYPPDTAELAETLAEHSDTVLTSYLDGSVAHPSLCRELVRQARAAQAYPVFFGSAITGAGIADLRAGITEFLPAARGADADPLDGAVFAIERDGHSRSTAVVRLFTGTLGIRDRVTFSRRDGHGVIVRGSGKATGVRAANRRQARVGAGGIAYVTGLPGIRVGDRLGSTTAGPPLPRFRPPTMETVVTAADPVALFRALTELAEQDPLIDLRPGTSGEVTVSLYGEVQRQVIAARLTEEYGVSAGFTPPRTICVERPAGVGHALTPIGTTHFAAGVGLRVEPGDGVTFTLEVERGSLPRAFMTAIEETAHRTLRTGPNGWQVLDCAITLTHTAYWSPVTVAGDFRALTALVLQAALRDAGTTVCVPWDRVEVEAPTDALRPVLTAIGRAGGLPDEQRGHGRTAKAELSNSTQTWVVTALVPADRVRDVERRLPDITGGVGLLTSRFAGYHPVR